MPLSGEAKKAHNHQYYLAHRPPETIPQKTRAERRAKEESVKKEKRAKERAEDRAARHAAARRRRYERSVAENQRGIDALKAARTFEDEVQEQMDRLSQYGLRAGIMAHIEGLKEKARSAGGRWWMVNKWDYERQANAAMEAWRRMNENGWTESPEREQRRLEELERQARQIELRERGKHSWGGWEPARDQLITDHQSDDRALAEALPAV
jgi:hypothetical protein